MAQVFEEEGEEGFREAETAVMQVGPRPQSAWAAVLVEVPPTAAHGKRGWHLYASSPSRDSRRGRPVFGRFRCPMQAWWPICDSVVTALMVSTHVGDLHSNPLGPKS